MIKHSTKAAQALRDLQMSLSIMLQVLKNLNDSLHVVGLKGFPVSIAIIIIYVQIDSVFMMLGCFS